ncbi:MAG: sigma-54 dependent transcriptional regulator [Cyclobacteriaceae bacterium]
MKKKGYILIVDDDPDVLHTAKLILKKAYDRVEVESSPVRLESILKKEDIDLVILDMNFKIGATTGNEGLFWLKRIKEISPETYVLMNTAYGDINLAVEAMKLGAVDFLVKPWEKEKFITTVNTVFQLSQSNKKINQLERKQSVLTQDLDAGFTELITKSSSMKPVLEIIRKVAATDASVLILGENGTGKELIAREIHRSSHRAQESLVKVDLGALPESLFESELFGHVKGAFTDAKEDRAGRFEIADGGSLFLDEIGNLSLMMQMKLLSVLQNRWLNRVGSSRSVPFDIRLISATNRPINDMVAASTFRQDLLYRINTVELELPPLRERREDIPLLVGHYLTVYSEKYNKQGMTVDERAFKKLGLYPWPGNIRELQHAVERAVIMSEGNKINAENILPASKRVAPKTSNSVKVEDVEKNAIQRAIEMCGGNLSQAAEELGIGRTTLYRKMKKYGLD